MLDGDLDVVEVDIVEILGLEQSGFDECLGNWTTMLFKEVLVE